LSVYFKLPYGYRYKVIRGQKYTFLFLVTPSFQLTVPKINFPTIILEHPALSNKNKYFCSFPSYNLGDAKGIKLSHRIALKFDFPSGKSARA
jgi:hypothetical protein